MPIPPGAWLTLDASSSWTPTATSYVSTLSGALISGTTVSNISGDGYDVYYLSADNSALGGATYSLAGTLGGHLMPK